MKKFLSLVVVAAIAGCSKQEPPKKPDSKIHPDSPTISEVKTLPSSKAKNPFSFRSPYSKLTGLIELKHECFAVANFGIYGSTAVLRLKPARDSSSDNTVRIVGEYFYLKHGKRINLSGSMGKTSKVIRMKESYQNKPTGYFELHLSDASKSFWTKPDSKVKETAELIHVCKRNSQNYENNPTSLYFNDKHKVHDWSDKDFPAYDVMDEVWASKLPDGNIVFRINVVGGNFHIGGWYGIAVPTKSENTYYHQSHYDWANENCSMYIDLTDKKGIVFRDVDCGICCGARARLDGKYGFRSEEIIFSK